MNEFIEAYQMFARLFRVELTALLLSLPRLYAFLSTAQLLSSSAVPQLSRSACVLSLSIISVPINMEHAAQFDGTIAHFALLFAKEYALGFVLGYFVGWVFWSVQAAGALIDNQRGAAIASSIDPMQGHEASPLGIMFSHVFITYVFMTGAMLPIFGLVYRSFAVWPVTSMLPLISPNFPALILATIDNAMKFVVILAGPVVAVMFLAEFSLAMISRFAPQLQVFVLAMPIKSILAIFVLIFYLAVLIRHSEGNITVVQQYADYLFQLIQPNQAPPPPSGQ